MYGKDDENHRDEITGLSSQTEFGRPRWGEIFPSLATRHPGGTVGVFFCGPRVLSKQLYANSRQFTSSSCKFHFHKENF